MFTAWLLDFGKLFYLSFSTNIKILFWGIKCSRIWSSAQEYAVLVLSLNMVETFISMWPKWSVGNDLYHTPNWCRNTLKNHHRQKHPLSFHPRGWWNLHFHTQYAWECHFHPRWMKTHFNFAHCVTISLHPLFGWRKVGKKRWVKTGGRKCVDENSRVKMNGWIRGGKMFRSKL